MENCAGEDAIIKVDENFGVKLNKKCELIPTGCVINKAFNTAVVKYKVQKDGIIIKEGKMDMCAAADQASSDAKDMLKVFGAPSSCPVVEEKICANDHTVDLTKYKAMLGMARGHLIIDSEIKHDTVSQGTTHLIYVLIANIHITFSLSRASPVSMLKSKL